MPRLYGGFLKTPSLNLSSIKDMASYSVGNHLATQVQGMPSGVLPLLILTYLSPASAAHFFIAWVIAAYLLVIPASSSESLFIEGSQPDTLFVTNLVRSLRLSYLLLVPTAVGLLFAAPWVLGIFGPSYVEGVTLLRYLVLSALFAAFNFGYFSFLKVAKRVGEFVMLSAVFGIGTVTVSYVLLPFQGIAGAGTAFLAVNVATSGYIFLRNHTIARDVAGQVVRPDR